MTTYSAGPPTWRELYRAAITEPEVCKLPQRIDAARNAIMDRIEDTRSKPIYPECQQLHDAFNGLRTLQQESDRSPKRADKYKPLGSDIRKAG